jgi:hypothetical protein
MFGKSIISKKFIGIFISMLAAAGILTAGDSFASERKIKAVTSLTARQERVVAEHRDRKVIAPRDVRHGRAVVEHRDRKAIAPRDVHYGRAVIQHPDRHRTIQVYKEKHFPRHTVIRNHAIHRHFPSRHVVVRPRVGVIFSTLPVGYRTVWIADSEYYFYNGIYYRSAPYGYVVVNPPPPVVVVREYPNVIEPLEEAQGWVSVTVSTLNVHSGPTLNHPVIYQVTLDTVLEVYGKADGWLYVHLPNGEFGWITAAFTAEAEPPAGG